MPINYTGPIYIKGFFEREYNKVSSDYDRKSPIIVIGHPPKAEGDSQEISYKTLGFSSQQEYFDFLDNRISDLNCLMERKEGRGSLEEEIGAIVSDLKRTSFVGYMLEMEIRIEDIGFAIYSSEDDTIYFDPLIIILLNWNLGNVAPKLGFNFSDLFRHEFVHFDIGECLPYKGIRKTFRELSYLAETSNLAYESVRKGKKKFIEWLQSKIAQEFVRWLDNRNIPFEPDAVYKEIEAKRTSYKQI